MIKSNPSLNICFDALWALKRRSLENILCSHQHSEELSSWTRATNTNERKISHKSFLGFCFEMLFAWTFWTSSTNVQTAAHIWAAAFTHTMMRSVWWERVNLNPLNVPRNVPHSRFSLLYIWRKKLPRFRDEKNFFHFSHPETVLNHSSFATRVAKNK